MNPSEINTLTLQQLREARKAMMELDYLLELEKLSPEKQKEAAFQLSNVQLAYLKLRNTELKKIQDKLVANEGELLNGIGSLQSALTNLKEVEVIITLVASFLNIVSRIIPLVA